MLCSSVKKSLREAASARAAGVDLRNVRVDPYVALKYAIQHQKYHADTFLRALKAILQYFDEGPRAKKWAKGQSLLSMAILFGQMDATEYLSRLCCGALDLTSSDLSTPLFADVVEYDHCTYIKVSINWGAKCIETARLAHRWMAHSNWKEQL